MANAVPQRVFLVGCPRSGTTLLQSLLSAHPQITSFPETMFFMYLVGQWPYRWYGTLPHHPAEHVKRGLSNARVRLGSALPMGRQRVYDYLTDIDREDLKALFPMSGFSLKRQVDACVKILDTLAQEQQRDCWIEKSPMHVAYIDVIERYLGPVPFIHIIRNGADVVASLIDAAHRHPQGHWGRQYHSIDVAISQWKHTVALTQQQLHKPNHTLVIYERLVAETPQVLRELCGFLGREFDPAMVERYSKAAEQLILSKETWKAGTFRAIDNTNNTKFQEIFNASEQQYILDQLAGINPVEWCRRSEDSTTSVRSGSNSDTSRLINHI